jgi:amino acid adenylation domain-containing protein
MSTASSPASIPRTATLSFAQKRLWFLDRLGAGAALNVPVALRLRGALDAALLERALNEVARRHDTLRSSFAVDHDGRPTLHIAAEPDVRLAQHDLRGHDAAEREAERLGREELEGPFDLSRAPLLRATLLRLRDDEHILLLNLHHIVSDSWSVSRLLDELDRLLLALPLGESAALPELAVQYPEHAERQARELQAGQADRARGYWRERLAGLPPLDLAPDRPRPAELSWAGDSHAFALEPELSAALRELARRRGVTLAAVLLAAWQALLARLSGREDIVVGTPVSHRPRVDLEPLIGVFANLLVLRTDLSGDPAFADELLPRVRTTLFGALEHQELPFEQLVADLNPGRDLSRHALFQVQFVLVSQPAGAWSFAGLQAESLRWWPSLTGLDLDLRLVDHKVALSGRLIRHADLFDAATAERIVAQFVRLLRGVVENPNARLSELPLLDAAERALVLQTWNATQAALPDVTLSELVAAQAARTPQAVAVVQGAESLTFAELLARSGRLAAQLRAAGVGRGDLVGVLADRGPALVVALLAVLEAGAAYVPLDPALPAARLRHVLEDSGLSTLLCATRRAVDFAGPAVRVLEIAPGGESSPTPVAAPARASGPDDLAYIIYTSGSTGRPKGVAVGQRALVNLLLAMAREPGLSERDVLVAVTTVSFDIAALELFLPLITGARLVLADERQAADGRALAALLDSSGATVLQATPATWRLLLGAGWGGDARLRLLSAGETLTREVADELLARCGQLWNLYGPTEATIYATVQRVEPGAGPVPIGRPIANMQAYVLDARRQPLPVGVVGDLYLGGVGLAREYWRQPELTAQAFVPDPFRPGARLYRTGDRARFLADGALEFHGRSDRQVKLRGHRIELGEIERVLATHADVAECAVVLRDDGGEARLVAHVVGLAGAAPRTDELRAALQVELPAVMVPAHFVLHDALPRTSSQKPDYAALLAHDAPGAAREARGGPPSTPAEIWLAGLWRGLLKIEDIGVSDNFFDLGGHSLLAMEMLHAIEKQRGVVLQPRDTLVGTLGQLAAACERPAPPARGPLGRLLGRLLGSPERPRDVL